MTLDRVRKAGIVRFKYNYDFGDDWEHLIVIEGAVRASRASTTRLRRRQAGVSPEDCGGNWGYQHLLEVMADPAHPEHETCPSG